MQFLNVILLLSCNCLPPILYMPVNPLLALNAVSHSDIHVTSPLVVTHQKGFIIILVYGYQRQVPLRQPHWFYSSSPSSPCLYVRSSGV
jgi:hypothetical protein